MLSKFAYMQRAHSAPTSPHDLATMNLNNFDGLKVSNTTSTSTNNNTNANNHSNRDIELMMELPPASPISHISHVSHATTTHRSVSQNNGNINGVNNGGGNGLNGHQSTVFTGLDELQKPHSLSLSRATLSSKEFGVEKSLTAMGILALIAIILSALSIVLLIQFNSIQNQEVTDGTTVTGARWFSDVLDSGVVLVSFCLMLNLSCVVVCTGQSYFTAKMLKLPQGEERSSEFLKNTSGSRFLAVCSFFVSIPIFLVALCLLILLEFRTTPAVVSSALIGLAIVFMLSSFGHNVHLWRREQADINKRHAPPPGVFTGMNGGVFHHHHHHPNHRHQLNHRTQRDGGGASGQHHRFAYTNPAGLGGEGDGVDPLSVSNLSTLV